VITRGGPSAATPRPGGAIRPAQGALAQLVQSACMACRRSRVRIAQAPPDGGMIPRRRCTPARIGGLARQCPPPVPPGGVAQLAEHPARNRSVAGSTPASSTQGNGIWRSLVSAPASGAGGRPFESGYPDDSHSARLRANSARGDRDTGRCGPAPLWGVGQLAGRLVWDQESAGSRPAAPTTVP
jgi:hypothetical protein